MRYIDRSLISLFIIILSLVVGCSAKKSDKPIQQTEGMRLVVTNYTDEYNYFIYLNNEPVYFDSDRAIFTWEGYPLVSGKNDVRFVFNSLSDDVGNMVDIRMNVAVTKGAEVFKQEYVEGKLLSGEEQERLLVYNIESKRGGGVEYISLDSLEVRKVQREIKKLSLIFVSLLQKRDFESISKLLTIQNDIEIKSNYPKWFLESKEEIIDVCAVTTADDLDLTIGNKMVLVKPSNDFDCNDAPKKLLYMQHREHKASFSISSFLFALKKDGWGFFGQDGSFYSVKADFREAPNFETKGTPLTYYLNFARKQP